MGHSYVVLTINCAITDTSLMLYVSFSILLMIDDLLFQSLRLNSNDKHSDSLTWSLLQINWEAFTKVLQSSPCSNNICQKWISVRT